MLRVVYINGKEPVFAESFEEMFQSLSEEGIIVESVEAGEIKTKSGDSIEFGVVQSGPVEDFISEVEDYRDTLRESISKLKKQGINVSKTELNKLAKQFEFLSGKEVKPSKAEEIKEEIAAEADKVVEAANEEDDIPV